MKELKKLEKKLKKQWKKSGSKLKFSTWLVLKIAENFEMNMV